MIKFFDETKQGLPSMNIKLTVTRFPSRTRLTVKLVLCLVRQYIYPQNSIIENQSQSQGFEIIVDFAYHHQAKDNCHYSLLIL